MSFEEIFKTLSKEKRKDTIIVLEDDRHSEVFSWKEIPILKEKLRYILNQIVDISDTLAQTKKVQKIKKCFPTKSEIENQMTVTVKHYNKYKKYKSLIPSTRGLRK